MRLSVGSKRHIGNAQPGLAQTVEVRLKQGSQRFRVDRRKSRQYGIRFKVRFDFLQRVERNLRLLTPTRKCQRRCQCRVRMKRSRRMPDRAPCIFYHPFVISQEKSRPSAVLVKRPDDWIARVQPNRRVTFDDGFLRLPGKHKRQPSPKCARARLGLRSMAVRNSSIDASYSPRKD